jgi:hypothetical protein
MIYQDVNASVMAATLWNPPLGTYAFQTSLIHPGFLECLRHPWPFVWQFGDGFRGRPLFFHPGKEAAMADLLP